MKDYAIKLFGKTINVLPDDSAVSEHEQTSTSQDSKDDESLRRSRNGGDEEETLTATSSEVDDETNTTNKPNKEQEKTLKKPDKLVPCPRCNSMDTKFCYYNNYNVNQPRYFCKKCQRYWTSGGTMRNVPVGSGRRKSKNTPPNFHHIMVSESGFLIGPNSGFPVTFYPGPYWNVPTLGKHSREEQRTLRIDDPNKAAKSTIWSTLHETSGSLSGTGPFNAFESKGAGGRRSVDGTTMVLQANPAAFSRSLNFHERA